MLQQRIKPCISKASKPGKSFWSYQHKLRFWARYAPHPMPYPNTQCVRESYISNIKGGSIELQELQSLDKLDYPKCINQDCELAYFCLPVTFQNKLIEREIRRYCSDKEISTHLFFWYTRKLAYHLVNLQGEEQFSMISYEQRRELWQIPEIRRRVQNGSYRNYLFYREKYSFSYVC